MVKQKFTRRLIRKLAETRNVMILCHCATGEKQCYLRVLEKVIGKV